MQVHSLSIDCPECQSSSLKWWLEEDGQKHDVRVQCDECGFRRTAKPVVTDEYDSFSAMKEAARENAQNAVQTTSLF